MVDTQQLPTCPMAKACRGMTDRRHAGFWMFIPGLILILVGLGIVLFPQILVWLVALLFVAMGIGMLTMAGFMRGMGKRMSHAGR